MHSAVQTVPASTSDAPTSKKKLWAGRIISGLIVAFCLFDAAIKILKLPPALEGTMRLGYPASTVGPIGILLLACVALYAVPRTSILGAVLLTGYLGGAVASNVRVANPLFGYTLFPVYVGVLLWLGLYLRNQRLREFIPLVECEVKCLSPKKQHEQDYAGTQTKRDESRYVTSRQIQFTKT